MGILIRAASVFVLVLVASSNGPGDSKGIGLHPRVLMVLAPRDFTDQEYFDPRAVFEQAGAIIKTASTDTQLSLSHNNAKVRIDESLENIRLDQFDALVIVGGMGAISYLLNNEPLRNLIVAAYKKNKVVAAICVAPAILARAGILRNRQATCYDDKNVIDVLRQYGVLYSKKSVVISDHIVTANGPGASKALALGVLNVLRPEQP